MKKLRVILLCLSMVFMLTSCATVIKGTKETISIDSNVKGAKIYLDNSYIGETPYVGKIKKSKGAKTLKVSKDGYSAAVSVINSSYDNTALLNIFWGDCSTTDLITGAMWTYDPSSFYVNLEKVDN